MARPRIFVSSTFYDLKQVRADLERFIVSLGYDAVLNERGSIPYSKEDALENSCYREISNVDVLVALIGGRYSATSQTAPYSVSQSEIKTALQLEKPVFIFVDRTVNAEYETYKRNKGIDSISYASVDNRKIFEFLEEIHALPNNNPIAPFESSRDIIDYLREQWAGLFQRFLSEQNRDKELNLVAQMETTARTLNQLVEFLTEERKDKDQAIRDILLTTHPAFEELKKETKNSYRIFFENLAEMNQWLKARLFSEVDETTWDDPEYMEWSKSIGTGPKSRYQYLHILRDIFDEDGKLKPITPAKWNPNWIYITTLEAPATTDEDDIPF